jgi:hypothetical protein
MAQQWPILHQAVHGIPLLVIRLLGRRPSPAGPKVSYRNGRCNGFVNEIRAIGISGCALVP